MANGDYGYFGKGDTGYAQYMTAFNRNFGGSSGGGGTTTTKSELFSNRRRVRIFCILWKAERRLFPNGCVSKTLSEERPYHEGHNCKSAVRQKGHDYEVR